MKSKNNQLQNQGWTGGSAASQMIPFGLRQRDGRMITPEEAEQGADCGCVCPVCGGALVAKKGKVRIHHFAHAQDCSCTSGGETALHMMAKQILLDRAKIMLPPVVAQTLKGPVKLVPVRMVQLRNIRLEKEHDGIIPDVSAETDEGPLFVEIYVTHAVDAEKTQRIATLGVNTIEVDLSNTLRNLSKNVLESCVIAGAANRKWIWNAQMAAYRTWQDTEIPHVDDICWQQREVDRLLEGKTRLQFPPTVIADRSGKPVLEVRSAQTLPLDNIVVGEWDNKAMLKVSATAGSRALDIWFTATESSACVHDDTPRGSDVLLVRLGETLPAASSGAEIVRRQSADATWLRNREAEVWTERLRRVCCRPHVKNCPNYAQTQCPECRWYVDFGEDAPFCLRGVLQDMTLPELDRVWRKFRPDSPGSFTVRFGRVQKPHAADSAVRAAVYPAETVWRAPAAGYACPVCGAELLPGDEHGSAVFRHPPSSEWERCTIMNAAWGIIGSLARSGILQVPRKAGYSTEEAAEVRVVRVGTHAQLRIPFAQCGQHGRSFMAVCRFPDLYYPAMYEAAFQAGLDVLELDGPALLKTGNSLSSVSGIGQVLAQTASARRWIKPDPTGRPDSGLL